MLLIGLWACAIEPEPIDYGQDSCHFCQMTIVDEQHAAQFVSDKGKQYKFDAVECLLNELSEEGLAHKPILLVSSYGHPKVMCEAQSATYLVSEGIKSPMGANLSSFANQEEAKLMQEEFGGQLYDWTEIREKFDVEE